LQKLQILNLDIHNWTFDAFLAQLEEGVVVTPNIDHFIKLQEDEDFYDCYVQSEHIVCDSRIIQLLSKFLYGHKAIKDQIAGSDLFPAYCQYHKDNSEKVKVFLLGGTKSSAQVARDKINGNAGSTIIIEAYSPPFGFENDKVETEKIIAMINDSGATTLAVGVGAPKQEKWIYAHKDKMPGVKLYFAIGATIDFQAGVVKRAPRWMVKLGLEWLYRMIQEPGRMAKRYLVDDLPFLWLITKQKLGFYKNPWK
jgi:N-acetylglucosaminyldiphosphoundecaprenol N-acetyl-beta-D-mannosaminyltransferase